MPPIINQTDKGTGTRMSVIRKAAQDSRDAVAENPAPGKRKTTSSSITSSGLISNGITSNGIASSG